MLYTAFDIDVAKEVWKEEAKQEGLREGERKGRQEGLCEVAKSLLDVLDIKTIAQKTGLSIDEIEKLK